MDSRWVTARTPHRCEGCARWIVKGERYHRWKGITDDGWRTYSDCEQCHECASDLWDAEYRDENEDGYECYAYLPEVDWHDVGLWSPLWSRRADLYRQQWTATDGAIVDYPADTMAVTS
jgi:hypothetical protein